MWCIHVFFVPNILQHPQKSVFAVTAIKVVFPHLVGNTDGWSSSVYIDFMCSLYPHVIIFPVTVSMLKSKILLECQYALPHWT